MNRSRHFLFVLLRAVVAVKGAFAVAATAAMGAMGAIASVAAVPAHAANAPMNYLRTYGPAVDPATRLNWGMLAISIAVCVIIAFLLLLAIFRRRTPPTAGTDGRLPLGRAVGGMRWIYIGAGISTAVLFVSAVWTVMTLSAVAAPGTKPAITIEITGHQWWWEVKYSGDTPEQTVVTANEIHIPVGEPVQLRLGSADVIHSFWVPQLAGKTDMIPGQINRAWLQADKAGDYLGQCGEYCGMQHTHMALHVIAEDRAQFDAWFRQQTRDAPAAQNSQVIEGRQVFMAHCAVCHTVRGTDAGGKLGPDLTHLMSRGLIASGMLRNNTGNLSGWVADAPALKPGSLMPRIELSPQELHAIVTYLQSLQ